jgi:hypothetical protein
MLLHRTTNTTRRKAAMVVIGRDGKWQPQDVYDWPPYCVCDWVTSAVLLARRVPDVPPTPPVVPYTPSAELKALVLKHYDPAESLASKRPMFRDEFGIIVLEVFARQNSVKPAEIERVLEHFGLPTHPPPGWAERVIEALGLLVPVDCPLCGVQGRTPLQVRVDSSIPDRPRYVCSACHHRWPVSASLAEARQ